MEKLKAWEYQYADCKARMGTGGQEKLDDFKAKLQVLIDYNYLDNDLNLLFKGKVACDIQNTDKIVTTELIFSGLLRDLPKEELVALVSVLVFQVNSNKATQCSLTISEGFQKAVGFI